MAATRHITPTELPRPNLLCLRAEAAEKITAQIEGGRQLVERPINTEAELAELKREKHLWSDYVQELLGSIFSNTKFAEEFNRGLSFHSYQMSPTPQERLEQYRRDISGGVVALESIMKRLEFIAEPPDKTQVAETTQEKVEQNNLSSLHPLIRSGCSTLYQSGHLGEAVEKSFKIVRDQLRVLTGFEKGSEAFGKGHLHIKGAVAAHVDNDFQEAVKFLLMSIDNFRNEKAHSSDSGVASPERAYEYLVISSLAMRHLDNAETLP